MASITTHSKSSHMSSIKSHHTVSNTSTRMKPPVCPNRHQPNHNSNSSNYNKNALPAVHNTASSISATSNNNLLHNNSQFKNNHYTFSLNRLSRHTGIGGGFNSNSSDYLDSLPYHNPAACYYAATYGDGTMRTTRATKSDIGFPITSSSSTKRRQCNRAYHNNKFANSHTTPNINEYTTNTAIPNNNSTVNSNNINDNDNNNMEHECTNNGTNPYYIRTAENSCNSINSRHKAKNIDYLENYKVASMQFYNSHSRGNNLSKKNTISNGTSGPLLFLEQQANATSNGNYAVPINVSTTDKCYA